MALESTLSTHKLSLNLQEIGSRTERLRALNKKNKPLIINR